MDLHTQSKQGPGILGRTGNLIVLTLPMLVLGINAWNTPNSLLFVGTLAAFLGCVMLVRAPSVWAPPVSIHVVGVYLICLCLFWFGTREQSGPLVFVGRGIMMVVALMVLIVHDLTRTGVEPRRKAKKLIQRLVSRTRWPLSIDEIARLPEVVGLRPLARQDPSLVLTLLEDRRVEVQAAALYSLLERPYWRREEARLVLSIARRGVTAEVRALALLALASAETVDILQGISEFLKDPHHLVRHTALRSLLAGGETRWALVRIYVRTALSDVAFAKDGPLPFGSHRLPAVAVCDLTGWAAESSPLAERSVHSLLKHYSQLLKAGREPQLASDLGAQVTEPQTPALLRVELAQLLRDHGALTHELLDRMTDPDQPSAIRLLAVGILLKEEPHDPGALDVLRGLGRQSNRDTAVAIGRILQEHLGLEFGIPAPGIPIGPKQAAEITQKVQRWAMAKSVSSNPHHLPVMPDLEYTDLEEDSIMSVKGSPKSVPGVNTHRHKY